jgi:hypothetical protein
MNPILHLARMADVNMGDVSSSSSSSEDEAEATERLVLQAKAMAMLDLCDDCKDDYLLKNSTVSEIARATGVTLTRAAKVRKDSSNSEWSQMLKDPLVPLQKLQTTRPSPSSVIS